MKNLVKRIKDMPLPQLVIDKILNNMQDETCDGIIASGKEIRDIPPNGNLFDFMLEHNDQIILSSSFRWKTSKEGMVFWIGVSKMLSEQNEALSEAESIINGG